MKRTHRIPDEAVTANMTGKLDPEYEAEVADHTARREREYREAEKRVEAAERRRERVAKQLQEAANRQEKNRRKRELAKLEAEVEERRQELARLSSLIASAPASARHRGVRSYKPVPERHGPNF